MGSCFNYESRTNIEIINIKQNLEEIQCFLNKLKTSTLKTTFKDKNDVSCITRAIIKNAKYNHETIFLKLIPYDQTYDTYNFKCKVDNIHPDLVCKILFEIMYQTVIYYTIHPQTLADIYIIEKQLTLEDYIISLNFTIHSMNCLINQQHLHMLNVLNMTVSDKFTTTLSSKQNSPTIKPLIDLTITDQNITVDNTFSSNMMPFALSQSIGK